MLQALLVNAVMEVIRTEKAYHLLRGYFDLLAKTGYVKDATVMRFLMWLFILDFASWMQNKITPVGYDTMNKALLKLFTNGCCLMPYDYIKENSLVVNEVEF